MALTTDQILAAQKANLETLFGLTTKAFEGIEKLVELNVTASKAALSEAATTTQAMLSVKDAQELLTLQASLFQPLAEKTAAYSRHLYDIAQGTGSEFGKAFESKAAEAQQNLVGMVDSAAKNAPAGSETAVAVMKSAVAAANNAFVRAEGGQAGFRRCRSQLPGCLHDGRQRCKELRSDRIAQALSDRVLDAREPRSRADRVIRPRLRSGPFSWRAVLTRASMEVFDNGREP
jgi:phasin family protein